MSTKLSIKMAGKVRVRQPLIRNSAPRRRLAPTLLGVYLAFNLIFTWFQAVVPSLFLQGPLRHINLFLGLVTVIVAVMERHRNLPSPKILFESHPLLTVILLTFPLPALLLSLGRGSFEGWYRYIANFAIFFAAMLCIVSTSDFKRVMFLYLIGCFFSVGVGLYYWAIGRSILLIDGSRVAEVSLRGSRLMGASTDPSTFGQGVVLALPFCLIYGGQLTSKLGRLFYTILAVGIVIAIAASVSRSSAVVAGIGLLLVSRRPDFKSVRTLLMLGVGILIAVQVARALAPEAFLSTYELYEERLLTDSRTDVWISALQAVVHVGPIGWGPGSDHLREQSLQAMFPGAVSEGAYRATHNFYLSLGLDLGWIGLALFLALLSSAYVRFRRVEIKWAAQTSSENWVIYVLYITLIEALVGMIALNVIFPLTMTILGCSVSPLLAEHRQSRRLKAD